MRHAASLLEAAHIASAAHRRSTAQVHAACSRVPITSRTSNRAIQVSCCVNVAHMDRPKFFSPACWIPCGRSHSAAISAALISAAHLSISLWMNSWRYSGDLRSGATKTEPNSFRRSSVAGALIAATVALWSFCTIAAGVPLGKTKENQAPASKLASPCSCADARFGRVGERFFVRTVNAADRRTGRFRSRPQDGPWRSRRVASRCHLRARTVSESMRAPILSLGATSSSIACMIEGTPAITITLPIPEARRPRHLVEDEIRALGDARHAQACLVHLGAGRLHPFVQDGERARIGVDRNTKRLRHAVGGDVTVGRPDTAGGEDIGVAMPERIECIDDRSLLIADHSHFLEIDADRGQILRDIADVLVLGAAGQDLTTDHQERGRDNLFGSGRVDGWHDHLRVSAELLEFDHLINNWHRRFFWAPTLQ